jgi:hypothetical protein
LPIHFIPGSVLSADNFDSLFEFPPLCSVLAVLFVIEVDAFDGMSPFTPSANVKSLLYRCELATGGVKARWGGYG